MRYKIWDKKERLITPAGTVLTPEQVFKKYPAAAIDGIDWIIEDSPINMGVFMQYDKTVDVYKDRGANIAPEMSKQEILDAIRDFERRKPEPVPTAEERIASAMEFQNILAMEDVKK